MTTFTIDNAMTTARLTRTALLLVAASWTVAPLAGWAIGWLS